MFENLDFFLPLLVLTICHTILEYVPGVSGLSAFRERWQAFLKIAGFLRKLQVPVMDHLTSGLKSRRLTGTDWFTSLSIYMSSHGSLLLPFSSPLFGVEIEKHSSGASRRFYLEPMDFLITAAFPHKTSSHWRRVQKQRCHNGAIESPNVTAAW